MNDRPTIPACDWSAEHGFCLRESCPHAQKPSGWFGQAQLCATVAARYAQGALRNDPRIVGFSFPLVLEDGTYIWPTNTANN